MTRLYTGRRWRSRAAALALAALAALLSTTTVHAQSIPSIKFPGPAATPVAPGSFVAPAGSIVRWYVVFDNTLGFADVTLSYLDIMDPLAVTNCDASPPCANADRLTLLCSAPDEPDPATGIVATCDPGLGRLDLRSITVPTGGSTCISFSTRVPDPFVGTIGNVGCVDVTLPFPSSSRTVPTTSAAPTCVPPPAPNPIPGCSTFTVPATLPPSFSGVKTATVEDINANGFTDVGDRITWTITLDNGSPDPHDAWIYDSIPVGTTFVDITLNPDSVCTLVGTDIECPALTFDPGEVHVLQFRTDFTCGAATDDDSFTACNQAQICGDAFRLNCSPSDNDATLPAAPTCVPFPFSDLTTTTKVWSFSDDDGDGVLSDGDRLTFSIRVRNTGTRTAERVTVLDTLDPSCLDLATLDPQNGNYDTLAGEITWVVGDMPPGDLQEMSFLVDALGPIGSVCCNQARINSDERIACGLGAILSDDESVPGGPDPTCVTFGPQPVLHVEKSFTITNDQDGDGFPDNNDTLEFTISISNSGAGIATGVTLDDPLAACWGNLVGADVVVTGEGTNASEDAPFPPVNGGRVLVNDIGGPDGLAPLSAETVTVTYTVDFRDLLGAGCCNRADVFYAESPVPARSDNPATPFPGDATCTSLTPQEARLVVTKTMADQDGDGCFAAGENLTFTLSVEVFDTDAGSIVLTDQLNDPDDALTVVDPGMGIYDALTDRITWDIGDKLQGESVVVTWIGRFDCDAVSGQAADDLATAIASNSPPATAGLSTTLSTPELVLDKTEGYVDNDASGDLSVGDSLTYTITLTNAGTCIAQDVVVTDAIDHDLDVTSLVTTGPPLNDGAGGLRWDQTTIPVFASMAGGLSEQFTVTGTVLDPRSNPDPAHDGIIANVALASARTDFACPVGDTSPSLQDIIAVPSGALDVSVAVAEEDGNGCFEPGEILTFTLTITAVGTAADQVTLIDTIRDPDAVLSVLDTGGAVHDTVASTLKWNLGLMTVGETRVFIWTAAISCDAPITALFSNIVTASSTSVPPDEEQVDSGVSGAIIEIMKDYTWEDDGDGVVEAGEVLKYTITVTNIGTCTARGVWVDDLLDTDLDRATAVPSGMGTEDGAGTVSWVPGELALTMIPPGGGGDLTLSITVLDPLTNPDPTHDGVVNNYAQGVFPGSFNCPPAVIIGTAPSFTIDAPVPDVRILRNDFVSCLRGATATMRQFLRERPVPQECSEPTALDDTHRGTQVIVNALSPFPFAGDATPASSLPACPQSGIGFGRILVFYELDDPPPACITTLRLAKGAGGEVILSW